MKGFMRRLKMSVGIFFKFFKVSFQITWGVWKLGRLAEPRVTVFGGSKISLDHPYALKAMELAQKLVDSNISVLTGGGPGIMQAANCGAKPSSGRQLQSMGIGVTGLDEKKINECVQDLITVDYFFARKWLLTHYSAGYAIFPGGFGTLDELGEVTTLMQTGFLGSHPIVLIGTEYWRPFMNWVNDSALKEGLLKEKDKNLLMVVDDINVAVAILKHRVSEQMAKKKEAN